MKTPSSPRSLLTPLTGSIVRLLALVALTPFLTLTPLSADEARGKRAPKAAREKTAAAQPSAQKSNPRSPDAARSKGLDYLLSQQHPDGGWGQGGGWRQGSKGAGRVEGTNVEDPSDLGNTCVSFVLLLRAGHTPTAGEHREAAAKALDYVCRQVDRADAESLYVTDVRDTQLQIKIGTYVDTFLAGWALSEAKGKVADEAVEMRRAKALEKVVSKIERNQRDDGSFAGNNGWAAVLSQGLASKALNNASRSGAKVSQSTLEKDQVQNKAGLDLAKGDFSGPTTAAEPSSAGVSLYREAAKLGGLREKSKSNVARQEGAEKTLADVNAPAPEKKKAQEALAAIAEDKKAEEVAAAAVSGKLSDTHYTAGFGNNGGEEFLSYLNLTESLHEKGGKDWENWRAKMSKTICEAQNEDGSWAGNHCITGRTFCTAAALLTLWVEQQPADGRVSSAEPAVPSPLAEVK